ncbi:tyrosine-type recombinase/integrase [Wukongibacter sp. M2B1]|uniref:tyrosine-type recombinase/integrase n=1 Tax=Wukongibacter sp. M2B1 TaxID=3088895 RepID=UPI003D790CFC
MIKILSEKLNEYIPAYKKYLLKRNLKDETIEQYILCVRKVMEYLDKYYGNTLIDFEDIEDDHILQFKQFKKSEGSSEYNQLTYLKNAKYFFQFLYKEYKMINVPLLINIRVTIHNKEKHVRDFHFFSKEEIARIILKAKETYLDTHDYIHYRNYIFIVLAVYAGLSLAELHELKDSDFDFEDKTINIRSGRVRSFYMSDGLFNILQDYTTIKNSWCSNLDYFFISRQKEQWSAKAIQDSLKQIIIDSGIEKNGRKFSPRTIRHTAIKTMVENKVELPIICNISGLKFKTLLKYIELFTPLPKLKESLYLEEHPLLECLQEDKIG